MGSSHFSAWHLSRKAVAGTSRAAPNKSAAHGSPCGTERGRRIPGVMTSSSLIQVSDLLYSLIHADTNTGGTFRASMASMVRDVVKSCCDVTVHHEYWYPPLICLLHHAAQDEDHLMGLTARDLVWIAWPANCCNTL